MIEKTDKLLFYYENLVNWQDRLQKEGPFLRKVLEEFGAKKVLDCGCGVGRHVIYLRQSNFEADGSDLNPHHVARAVQISATEAPCARFFLEDMTQLDQHEDCSYDAIMSLGNTLSSLGYEGVKKAFSSFARVLRPQGILIGQVLNYNSFDRKDRSEVRSAIIDGQENIFVKTFHFEPDHIIIIVNVLSRSCEVNADDRKTGFQIWDALVDATKMYPLNTEFIKESLISTGFVGICFYGSLKGDQFNAEKSRDLIFVAKKKEAKSQI